MVLAVQHRFRPGEPGPVRHWDRDGAGDYPSSGRIEIRVDETSGRPWTLALRVPQWCRNAAVTGPDGPAKPVLTRVWRPGDTVVLDLDMAPGVIEPDPHVDAVRGCVAVARGPIVYCLESADLPAGAVLEDLRFAGPPTDDVGIPLTKGEETFVVQAVPYHSWANRQSGAMRVWIPR